MRPAAPALIVAAALLLPAAAPPAPQASGAATSDKVAAILEQARAGADDATVLEAAQRAIELELRAQPRLALAHFAKGWVLARRGELEASLKALQRAITLDPAASDAHFEAGRVLRRLARPDEALRRFDAAHRADPKRVDALAAAADLLTDAGKAHEALARWKRAQAAAPEQFAVLEGLIRAHRAVKDHAGAEQARDALLATWRKSTAPAVKARTSYVTERFALDQARVTVHERLDRGGSFETLYRFAVADLRGRRLGEVVLEASAAGRALGAGYVVAVVQPDGVRTRPGLVFAEIPDYATLKVLLTTVIRDGLLPKPPPPAPAPAP